MDKKPKTELLFDEARAATPKIFNLVGGEYDIDFTLDGYDTKKCKLTEKAHKKNNQAIFKSYNGEVEKISIPDDGKFATKIMYEYGAAKFVPTVAFKYLLPKRASLIQTSSLAINTCRHQKMVAINICPDIKWEVAINATLAPDKYTFRNFKPGAVYNKALEKAKESGKETAHTIKTGKTEATFELVIGCEYNDGANTDEFGSEKSEHIRAFLKTMLKIKQGVETIFDFTNGKLDTAKQSKGKVPAAIGKAAVSFTVHMPNIEFLGAWQAAYDNSLNEYYTKGSISLAAKPLIGAEISVDFWQLGAKGFPLVGFIQTAIDKLGKNTAEVYVEIVLTVSGALNVNALTIPLNSHDKDDSIVEGGLEGKLAAKLEVVLELGLKIVTAHFEAETKVGASLTLDSSISASATFGTDDNGLFFKPQLNYSGLKGELVIEGEVSIKTDVSFWKDGSAKVTKQWKWDGTIIKSKENIGDFKKQYMLNF